MPQQVFHGLSVYLYGLQVNVIPLEQMLGKDPHARAYFQHVPDLSAWCQSVCDGFGYVLIRKEMLSEGFLRSYFHRCCLEPALDGWNRPSALAGMASCRGRLPGMPDTPFGKNN